MALALSEDERLLVESTGGLLARSSPVSAFRALRDGGDPRRYDPALWKEMAAQGLVAPHVPESEGGLGMGYAAAGLIAQACGRTLAASPLFSAALAAELLLAVDAVDVRAELLPPILDGTRLIAFAFEEAARHDPDRRGLTATPDGSGGYRLDGVKRMVVDGGVAHTLLVAAEGPEGLLLLRVDMPAEGVTVTPLDLIDHRNMADVAFTGVRVDSAAVLAKGEAAERATGRALDLGRALLAAELLGLAEEAFERTLAYLKERVQFGVRIGSFQALQHRAARLHIALELAAGVVLKALRSLDDGDPAASALASLAKAVTTRTAREVTTEAVQLHGGIGLTDEFDIGFFLKRARVAGDLFGDDAFHKDRLAKIAWTL